VRVSQDVSPTRLNVASGRANDGTWMYRQGRLARDGVMDRQDLVEPTERPDMGEQHCGERPDTMSGPVRERSRIIRLASLRCAVRASRKPRAYIRVRPFDAYVSPLRGHPEGCSPPLHGVVRSETVRAGPQRGMTTSHCVVERPQGRLRADARSEARSAE
jgi:hypothetical protein